MNSMPTVGVGPSVPDLGDVEASSADKMSESRPEDEEDKVKRMDLRYMHRPPRIVPNYGKKTTSILPKSNVSRVLLYDNVTQQQMLDVKLSGLKTEQQKTGRLLDLHRKSFLLRRLMKHQHAQEHKTVTSGVLHYLLPMLLSGEGSPETRRRVKFLHSSAGEYRSSGEDELKLPDIGERRSGTVTFHQKTSEGLTRMLHTLHSGGGDSGRRWARRRTVLDKRFQGLENLLVQLEEPGNGYIELSPSYHREPLRAVSEFTRLGVIPATSTHEG